MLVAIKDGSTGSPRRSHSSLNFSRSSAISMDSKPVPRISTWHSSKTPLRLSCMARFKPVCPPRPGKMASGRS